MTKDEIAGHLAEKAGISKERADAAYNSLLDLIAVELRGGRNFLLRDVGTLQVKQMAARIGRNPHSGQKIDIPARRSVKFNVAPAFSEQLNA